MHALPLLFASSSAWSPFALGSSLLFWWDADRPDLISQSGGAVSSWTDIIQGCAVAQGTGGNQPIYSATGFNSRSGGITFDGTDDYLRGTTNLSALPTGAAPSEEWWLVDQTAAAADTNTRPLGSFGSAGATARRVDRVVSTGVNRGRSQVGDGAVATSGTNANVDFSGRHVVRSVVGASQFTTEVDGTASSATVLTPNTNAGAITFACNASATPTLFFQGVIAARIITNSLSADQATQLYAYLNLRR